MIYFICGFFMRQIKTTTLILKNISHEIEILTYFTYFTYFTYHNIILRRFFSFIKIAYCKQNLIIHLIFQKIQILQIFYRMLSNCISFILNIFIFQKLYKSKTNRLINLLISNCLLLFRRSKMQWLINDWVTPTILINKQININFIWRMANGNTLINFNAEITKGNFIAVKKNIFRRKEIKRLESYSFKEF